jgi:hypothetical protein
MPNQLEQIIAFGPKRYNENRDIFPNLAKAYLAIMNHAIDVHFRTRSISAMLAFLSKPHIDPDMAKACQEVLEHIGVAPSQ